MPCYTNQNREINMSTVPPKKPAKIIINQEEYNQLLSAETDEFFYMDNCGEEQASIEARKWMHEHFILPDTNPAALPTGVRNVTALRHMAVRFDADSQRYDEYEAQQLIRKAAANFQKPVRKSTTTP